MKHSVLRAVLTLVLGLSFAFVACGDDGETAIWLRIVSPGIEIDQVNLDRFHARPLTTSSSTGRPSVSATPPSLTNQTMSASEDTTDATMATEEPSLSDDEPQDSI